jgi:hypothetical protein
MFYRDFFLKGVLDALEQFSRITVSLWNTQPKDIKLPDRIRDITKGDNIDKNIDR